jgi:hypothetical protein
VRLWIFMDPGMDFHAIFAQLDVILMGRKTCELAGGGSMPGMDAYVFLADVAASRLSWGHGVRRSCADQSRL